MTKIKSKIISLIFVLTILLSLPTSIYAQEETTSQVPTLTSISFKNASLDQEFNPNISEYTITLDDPSVAPTLKENTIDGNAKLFITYEVDSVGKQTGIKATLKYSNISIDYKFMYSNPPKSELSSNNNLGFIDFELCEVYPKLNDKDTNYKLYIPSDLNELKISAATQDPNATCKVPSTIKLNDSQTPTIKIDVTATNSSKKTYTFKLERLDITCEEIKSLPDSQSLAKDKITNEKLELLLILGAFVLGVIALIVFIVIAKKLTVKVYDEDENDFFDIIEPKKLENKKETNKDKSSNKKANNQNKKSKSKKNVNKNKQ